MASKSRAVQEQLAELEKASAPFEVQLIEAAKFIGKDLDRLKGRLPDAIGDKKSSKRTVHHGREEWLLRWLLKKLQAPKDDLPRQQSSSWWLFRYLIKAIPLPIVARLLIEKKFMSILRQTLDEAQKRASAKTTTVEKEILQSSPKTTEPSSKKSKKRKRSPELIKNATGTEEGGLIHLMEAIHATLEFIIQSTKPIAGRSDVEESGVFSAECMKTATRSSGEELSVILGLWLSLSAEGLKIKGSSIDQIASWTPPFIELWQARVVDGGDMVLFSLHTSQSLLQLLRAVRNGYPVVLNLVEQLEQLIARNIITPSKLANMEDSNPLLFETLTRSSVIQETANAPIFFDVAIRSIQSHGSRRRRPQDNAWLQSVFRTLQGGFVDQKCNATSNALNSMLQSAIKFKVDLDLPTLRTITAEYALTEDRTHWTLLAALLQLDGNIFLIPDAEHDLLVKLLAKITKASIEEDWVGLVDQIVLDICVPLMAEFAKARDLSGFIRHWYAQLVEFERLRQETRLFSMEMFSAWEDDALQEGLSKLLEPSLTVQQINEIIEFLESEAPRNPNAVCVILQAISGSISQEEVVDMVDLRLCNIIFEAGRRQKLDQRYAWRFWKIPTQSLQWLMRPGIDKLASLLEGQAQPFKALMDKSCSATLLDTYGRNTASLEGLEMLRCGCAMWTASGSGGSEGNLRSMMFGFIKLILRDIRTFPHDLLGDTELAQTVCGSRQKTLYRDIGWIIWSIVRCIFVEYPKALEFSSDMRGDDELGQLLKIVFWLCSASTHGAEHMVDWLRLNSQAFPDIWMLVLQNDVVLNCPSITEKMIDMMLADDSNTGNPLVKPRSLNIFAIRSLLQVPLEIFSKQYRERVMTKWGPVLGEPSAKITEESKLVATDPAVLSLKIRVMQRPTFYQEMSFQNLVDLANVLADPVVDPSDVSLDLFKELVRLTFRQMTENMDQSRSRAYIEGSIGEIKRELKPHTSKTEKRLSFSKLSYPLVALIDVALAILCDKTATLNDLGIISKSKLQKLTNHFKEYLLSHLVVLAGKLAKESPNKHKRSRTGYHLALTCAIDALSTLGVTPSELAAFMDKAKLLTDSEAFMSDSAFETARKLETFLAVHGKEKGEPSLVAEMKGDVSTVSGRLSILDQTHAATAGKDRGEKLKLIDSIFGAELTGLTQLDKLLAAREVIVSCEDVRKSSGEEADENEFDLSMAYSILCGHLWKAAGLRQFCLISETLELMLQTKGRSMTQWNIDSTLGSITIMCSRNGPSIRPNRAGTVYLHVCHLMQAVLTSHRMKLQGHFHLVVQVMQTLLRCLFTPLPHGATKTTKFLVPPPWLSSPKHQLTAKHAEAYTRLLTMICDPTVSSVTRSNHNPLISATARAKGMAAPHMQFVLTTYIKLQLEMRMLPEIREKMVPGLYAIFDATTPEMRRMINESLDASGRAVFASLFRDYSRFGKWKGS